MSEAHPRPKPQAIFFDLGGTLLTLNDNGEVARDAHNQVTPLPGVLPRLRHDHAQGHRIFVITNQSRISRGDLTNTDVGDWMNQLNAASENSITAHACCAHPVDAGCPCRKPQPGLIHILAHKYRINLRSAAVIGDSASDRDCAQAAGITDFRWAAGYFTPTQPPRTQA